MKDLLLIPVIFFSSRRNYHSFMETLSYCQWTFPYWFCQFSYLLFTETEFYTADLSQNGLFDFTTLFIIFNLVLLALACWAGYKWKRGYQQKWRKRH